MNGGLPDVQAGFRKGRESRDQIANIYWISEKQENSGKTSTSSLVTPKLLTVYITTNWKILKQMGIADNLSFLPRNHLYSGQEATVRTIHGTMG